MKKQKSGIMDIILKILFVIFYFLLITADVFCRKLRMTEISLFPPQIILHEQLYLSHHQYILPSLLETWLSAVPFLIVLLAMKSTHDKTIRSVEAFLESRKEAVEALDMVYPDTADIDFYQKCSHAVNVYDDINQKKQVFFLPVKKFQLIDDTIKSYQETVGQIPVRQKKIPHNVCDFSALAFLEEFYPDNPLSAYSYVKNIILDEQQQDSILHFLKKVSADLNAVITYTKQNQKTILRRFTDGYPLFDEKLKTLQTAISGTKPTEEKITLKNASDIIPKSYQKILTLEYLLSDTILERYQIRISYYQIQLLKIGEEQPFFADLCRGLEQEIQALYEEKNRFSADTGILYPLFAGIAGLHLPDETHQNHRILKINALCREADNLLETYTSEKELNTNV